MENKETAIKLWVDESTEINEDYILVGYLITDCGDKEYSFFKNLTDERRDTKCFTTLRGRALKKNTKEIKLFDKWLRVFNDPDYKTGIYFHSFLYKRDEKNISKGKNFEHYFAKQSVFSLALKMRGGREHDKFVSKMFDSVKTVTVLFDNRGDHIASILSKEKKEIIKRIPQLENIYKSEIINQIERQTGKSSKTPNLTVRFSFVSDECFDGIQFTDCFLYAIRLKLENNNEHPLVKVFDEHFLNPLNENVRLLGFEKIYKDDQKFNFFKAYEK